MTITYYIAAKFEDTEIFKRITNALSSRKDANYVLTIDWTKHENCKPYSENREVCIHQAIDDVVAIRNSIMFILAYDGKKGSGMIFELGYAYSLLAQRRIANIIITYDDDVYNIRDILDQSMFLALPEITFMSIRQLSSCDLI